MMITITEPAKEVLRRNMSRQDVSRAVCFRLVGNHGGKVILTKGERREGDIEFHWGGRAVLRVPPDVASELDRATIDVAAAENGRGLRLVVKSA
jgi:hypothetical protein